MTNKFLNLTATACYLQINPSSLCRYIKKYPDLIRNRIGNKVMFDPVEVHVHRGHHLMLMITTTKGRGYKVTDNPDNLSLNLSAKLEVLRGIYDRLDDPQGIADLLALEDMMWDDLTVMRDIRLLYNAIWNDPRLASEIPAEDDLLVCS